MQAIILSIGDELVLGQTVDTNSAWLSAQLAARGIGTSYHQTVADDLATITDAIRHASERANLVIISGGLGPTDDDLTRQALADAMGVDLVLHEPSLQAIRAMIEKRGRKMAERNKVQAYHPQGTTIIPNACGTAPGITTQLNKATIYVTPGVPREMVEMFHQSILPEIEKIAPTRRVILTSKINTFGIGESTVAQMLGNLCDRKRNPLVGTTVSDGLCSVRVRAEFDTSDEAEAQLRVTIEEVCRCLGPSVFGQDDQTLQEALIALLCEKEKTVATAESCTGGLIGKMLTDISGSSDAYAGGWVTYSNELKISQLDVDPNVIETHGAVSGQTAMAMAQGALEKSGADIAISITGIAGPGGGTADKPVGTVWIGLAEKGEQPEAQHYLFGGGRDTVRDRAAKTALQLVRLRLLGSEPADMTWRINTAATAK